MNLLSRAKPVVGPATAAEDPTAIGYAVAVASRETSHVLYLTDCDVKTRAQALAEIEKWQALGGNRKTVLCKVVVAE